MLHFYNIRLILRIQRPDSVPDRSLHHTEALRTVRHSTPRQILVAGLTCFHTYIYRACVHACMLQATLNTLSLHRVCGNPCLLFLFVVPNYVLLIHSIFLPILSLPIDLIITSSTVCDVSCILKIKLSHPQSSTLSGNSWAKNLGDKDKKIEDREERWMIICLIYT